MSPVQSFHANERVAQTLAEFATQRELEGLGDTAIGIIVSELRRAGLQDQVEDVFQNALLITWQGCRCGAVRKIRQYFLVVSRHEACKAMRNSIRRERNDPKVQDWLTFLSGEVCLPEKPVPDERELVLKALLGLSPERREIIRLMMVEGLDDAQINAAMNLTPAAFRTAKCRAVQDLRDILAVEVVRGKGRRRSHDRSARTAKRRAS
jgi:DNA-directed RNA polymerase specialized sigma24 family protein